MIKHIKLTVLLIICILPSVCLAELTDMDRQHIRMMVGKMFVSGGEFDESRFDTLLFGTEAEKKVLITEFRQNVLLPAYQKQKAQAEQLSQDADKQITDIQAVISK